MVVPSSAPTALPVSAVFAMLAFAATGSRNHHEAVNSRMWLWKHRMIV